MKQLKTYHFPLPSPRSASCQIAFGTSTLDTWEEEEGEAGRKLLRFDMPDKEGRWESIGESMPLDASLLSVRPPMLNPSHTPGLWLCVSFDS